MATDNNKNIITFHSGNTHFLYDAALVDDVSDTALFEHVNNLSPDSQSMKSTAQGRGTAVFFRHDQLSLVYKHYQRGGLVAKLLHDQYFGITLETTRAFREYRLLHQMQILDLPSPVPVAARVIQSGMLYKADLVMNEIEDTTTLADLCLKSDVENLIWYSVGRCIKQFHDKNVYHADLNARNILLGKAGEAYLIDFDKGCFREPNDSWKASNLSRLNRSLQKFKTTNENFCYTRSNWDRLLDGYKS